ncbi:MAG: OmpA family protein [Balneolaceae bacterium]|nr:OmpA family protein [Balneolaceae bacterium]
MTRLISTFILIIAFISAGCDSISKTAKGTVIGSGAGALAGAIIGKAAGNTTTGAIVGAAVGGASGAAIGKYMDDQSRELEEDLENATVERVGEGIKVTFDSGILFEINSAELSAESKEEIAELATVLKKYEDTNIMFAGHTDASGPEDYNQELSEERAKSVAEYAAFVGVDAERMTITGYGEEDPIASNETQLGREKNRRVEIAIWANDELKEAAEDGAIDAE